MDRGNKIRINRAGWLAVLLFFLLTLFTLSHYGIVWDSGQWFPYGDHHLRYFTTFDDRYLDWHMEDARDIEGYREYGPLVAIRASLSHFVFHRYFGMHPIDARHLPFVFDATAMVLFVFLFARRYLGPAAAFWGVVFLAFYPRFFAHAHNNVSDLPASAAFTAAAFFLAHGILNRSWAYLYLAAFCGGILFDLRPQNLPFLLVIALLWMIISATARQSFFSMCKREGKTLKHALILLLLFALGLYLFRPGAWFHPISEIKRVILFFLHRPGHLGRIPVFFMGERFLAGAPSSYPWIMLLYCSPPIFLACLLAGSIRSALSCFRKSHGEENRSRAFLCFLFLWALVSVGKHSLLAMGNYDGVRHFLEAFPAMAAIAGAGLVSIWQSLFGRKPFRERTGDISAIVLSLGIVIFFVLQLILFHPYEICYYNIFTGGIHGAEARFETEYSAHSYREGLDWLEKNAPAGSLLCVPLAGEAAGFYINHEALYDFTLIETNRMPELRRQLHEIGRRRGQEKLPPVYVLFILRQGFLVESGVMAHCLKYLHPVHTIAVRGVPVLHVYYLELS